MSNGRDCSDEQSLPTENCISGTAATPRPFSPENRRTMPVGGSAAKGGRAARQTALPYRSNQARNDSPATRSEFLGGTAGRSANSANIVIAAELPEV